jgi:dienelactone hydrolase
MRPLLIAIACLAAALFATPAAMAKEVETRDVEYTDGITKCKGFLAFDPAQTGKRPAVLVFPEWWGLNDYAKSRATQLAQLGYIAFAVDMYGEGKSTEKKEEAQTLATPFYSDPQVLRARARAALDTLSKQPNVDTSRVAAIGYCFGGSCALELARSGADLAAVVSFHGGLKTKSPADAKTIKAKVLVCTGAADPMVDASEREAFVKEMEDAKVDYQMVLYSGAVHAFTNPGADTHGIPGVKYDKKADERSWRAMQELFAETIGPKRGSMRASLAPRSRWAHGQTVGSVHRAAHTP